MSVKNRELWLAFLAIILITLLYLGAAAYFGSIPAARGFFGHSLGILGFLLMLVTETAYSLRKRSRSARWGRMAAWLQFHIFTGLVGPYMVLLHSAWKINGLAGVVLLLTVIIVVSGFIGRYIFTAVPRTADGVEIQARELGRQVALVKEELRMLAAAQPDAAQALGARLQAQPGAQVSSTSLVFNRFFTDLADRIAWEREKRAMHAELRARTAQLKSLADQERAIRRQLDSLAAARRMLAVWHTVHIPIGMALFTAALVHIAGAIYYATLLH
jgi:hypothetical protein